MDDSTCLRSRCLLKGLLSRGVLPLSWVTSCSRASFNFLASGLLGNAISRSESGAMVSKVVVGEKLSPVASVKLLRVEVMMLDILSSVWSSSVGHWEAGKKMSSSTEQIEGQETVGDRGMMESSG